MIYFDYDGPDEGTSITRGKFEKIFGISYKKSENNGIRFEDAFCGIDPYAADISGVTVPLVCSSFEDYVQTHNNYCDDI